MGDRRPLPPGRYLGDRFFGIGLGRFARGGHIADHPAREAAWRRLGLGLNDAVARASGLPAWQRARQHAAAPDP